MSDKEKVAKLVDTLNRIKSNMEESVGWEEEVEEIDTVLLEIEA